MPDTNPMMIVFFLCIYVAFYSFTWAPLTWVIVGEFPAGPSAAGRRAWLRPSTGSVPSWSALLFPIMTASMPQEIVFAIFGVICMLGVCFVTKCVPETRGHTLEEIEAQGTKRR